MHFPSASTSLRSNSLATAATTTTTTNKKIKSMSTNNKKKNKAAPSSTTVAPTVTSSKKNLAVFETILGTDLWKKTTRKNSSKMMLEAVPVTKVLEDTEFVALYFGSQSSRVSTQFSPRLVEFYNQVQSQQQTSKGQKMDDPLKVIYVSSDQSVAEFQEHFVGVMPEKWWTVPADTPEKVKQRNDLVPLFKAFRLPSLVILHGPTGEFVTEHGVAHLNRCITTTTTTTAPEIKKDAGSPSTPPVSLDPAKVKEVLEEWRNTSTKTIQDAHKLIDYGGGTMSILRFLYANPYVVVAIIAICMYTPIIKAITAKPMVLLGFVFLFKRYLTPKGDQAIPGCLLSMDMTANSQDVTYPADKKSN